MIEDYVKKNTRFLKLKDGDEETFTIRGYQEAESFGNPTMIYKIELEDGRALSFQTASVKFASAVMCLPNKGIDTKVRVSREGEGLKTKYEIEMI